MTKEAYIPIELTAQGNSFYSKSMSEVGDNAPKPNTQEAIVSGNRINLSTGENLGKAEGSEPAPIKAYLESDKQREAKELLNFLKGTKNVEVRHAVINQLTELGLAGGSGDIDDEQPEDGQDRQPTRQEILQAHREAQERAEVGQVLTWLTDSSAREDYFNDIFALVDVKPYDFWDRAFDQLNDGAREYYFNQVILNGLRGRWENIPIGRGDLGGRINVGLVQERLNETSPGKTVDELMAELRADFDRFQRERQVRKTLHDVNAILYLPSVKAEQLYESMQQFDSASGDLALSIPGVREMRNVYENVLREIMSENDGYLVPEKVLGRPTTVIDGGKSKIVYQPAEAERRAKKRFQEMVEAGLLMTRAKTKLPDGKWETKIKLDPSRPWEIDRIFTLARGMMIMEERLISLAAESSLPGNDLRFASGFLQDVIQGYPWKHLLSKWGITQEALAAMLFENKHDKGLSDLFKGWDPKKLKETYEKVVGDPKNFKAIEDSLDQTFYLARQNPNRAGDLYTWISWRGVNQPDVPSMLQDFLLKGRQKMEERWVDSHPGETVPDSVLDEYTKWTGTGFRFEKLRVNLAKFNDHTEKGHKEFKTALGEARQLLGRMVDLQPHRIYLVSRWVKERVDATLSPEQKETLGRDLENLSYVETAFLNAREELLDEGKTFDTLTIQDMEQFYDKSISNPVERQRAKDLALKIRQDYERENEKGAGDSNLYLKEFVYHRENTHGFVLWSGDGPADEFNFSALGATGGFARRARDNNNHAKAAEAEVALLDNLKNITHPDQLMASLFGIWSNIDHYDRGKARQAIAEKAEGYIKFYKATWKTNLPLGFALERGTKASYARMVYGPHAAAWESSDIRYFIDKMEHAQMITKEQAHDLMKYAGATNKHVLFEGVLGLGQLLVLVGMLVGAEAVFKNSLEDPSK